MITFDKGIQVAESLSNFGEKLRLVFQTLSHQKMQGVERSRIFMKVKEKLEEGKLTVCSIGAGYVGSLTSIVLAAQQPNLNVIVCDVNKDLIDRWND